MLVLDAQLATVVPGLGVAVMFAGAVPAELDALAERLKTHTDADPGLAPDEAREVAKGAENILETLKGMGISEKMQAGLTASREMRLQPLRDNNKPVHLYVLRNPRIGLAEVLFAARLASLSPEALKFIAEHREWGMNGAVCGALAKNPKIAVPLVLKLLNRVPLQELRALAKGAARQPIVAAARKILMS